MRLPTPLVAEQVVSLVVQVYAGFIIVMGGEPTPVEVGVVGWLRGWPFVISVTSLDVTSVGAPFLVGGPCFVLVGSVMSVSVSCMGRGSFAGEGSFTLCDVL